MSGGAEDRALESKRLLDEQALAKNQQEANLRAQTTLNQKKLNDQSTQNAAAAAAKRREAELAAQKKAQQANQSLSRQPNQQTAIANMKQGIDQLPQGKQREELGAALQKAEKAQTFNVGPKIQKQATTRGWTTNDIQKTIANPHRTLATRDTRFLPDGSGQRNDPATAFIRKNEHYVVENNINYDIAAISDRNNPNWKSPFK